MIENEMMNNETANEYFPELVKREFKTMVAITKDEDYKDVDTQIFASCFIKDCGIGAATVKKALASLVEKGLINWTNPGKRYKNGDPENSMIEFTDLGKDWIDAYKAGEITGPAKNVTAKKERNNSKRKQIEYDGKSQHICAWARELGMNANTLYNRIYKMGWSVEKAFETASARAKKNDEVPVETEIETTATEE